MTVVVAVALGVKSGVAQSVRKRGPVGHRGRRRGKKHSRRGRGSVLGRVTNVTGHAGGIRSCDGGGGIVGGDVGVGVGGDIVGRIVILGVDDVGGIVVVVIVLRGGRYQR